MDIKSKQNGDQLTSSPFTIHQPEYQRMPSSWMICHVGFVRADISEERIAFNMRVTRLGEPQITLAVTSN
jgi:hypothetical protein